MLVLLNSYPLLVSQNLVFRSKESSLSGSVRMIGSSLSGLARLNEENVAQALSDLRETGVSRILVTDATGRVLYDTRQTQNARGVYAFYKEITQALSGNDVFYCRYDSEAFHSRAAVPVVYRSQIVGAVYAYEYDAAQARLLRSMQNNLMMISALVAVLVAVLSLTLSRLLTRRISELLQSIRQVREGAYHHRANVRGSDEIAQIASEFNRLTDRLQTTESARRRFVADASHELKTPLAGIRLLSDSIMQTEGMDADTVREFVSDIGQEAERLSRITEDLLQLTRLDSAALDKSYAVPVAPILRRVARMLGPVAEAKEIKLSYKADENAAVPATEDDVHRILYNLMENGVKYSVPGGFVHTTVAVEDHTVVITVADDGIGIPDEEREQIFERFYRVDKMRSRAVGGTGLGLSIVHDTVVRRGGTITASSRKEGNGTVFTVRLPLSGGEAS